MQSLVTNLQNLLYYTRDFLSLKTLIYRFSVNKRVMQNISILLRVVLLGSQGLKDIPGKTESLEVISISPLRAEIDLVPRTDVHFIDTLS